MVTGGGVLMVTGGCVLMVTGGVQMVTGGGGANFIHDIYIYNI